MFYAENIKGVMVQLVSSGLWSNRSVLFRKHYCVGKVMVQRYGISGSQMTMDIFHLT